TMFRMLPRWYAPRPVSCRRSPPPPPRDARQDRRSAAAPDAVDRAALPVARPLWRTRWPLWRPGKAGAVRDPVQVLTRLGGVGTWRSLRRGSTWRAVQRALDDGRVIRVAQGRYALPLADEARVAGHRLS